jgi:putative transposase
LEQALFTHFDTLDRISVPFLLRWDDGLVFASRSFTTLVGSYGPC